MIVNYDRNCSFMVLDTVITIVNYDRHMFIVQATGNTNLGVRLSTVDLLIKVACFCKKK